jgi:predicted RNA-binding Zn ribbon-like protein
MHVADRDSSVSELLIAESLMGLSTLVCDLGATRLGVCDASGCSHVFVDTSPNQSRRYCSDRCSSRANVAAYRARQRQVEQAKRSEPTVQTKAAHV